MMYKQTLGYVDTTNIKLGAFVGMLVTAPTESKVWAVIGFILGVGVTWVIQKKKLTIYRQQKV